MKKRIIVQLICLSLCSLLMANEKSVAGFNSLRVIPSVKNKCVQIIFSMNDKAQQGGSVLVELKQPNGRKLRFYDLAINEQNGTYTINLPLRQISLWSPGTPNLYELTLKIKNGNKTYIGRQRFGLRELETRNGRFYLNGRPFYIRAYGGEGGCGCDDLSKKEIRKRLIQAKAYGFNAVRHHTHIPEEGYMEIADEVGILVQMEIGGNQIGDDVNSDRFIKWKNIWINMVKMGRTHPSTFIYGCGNEMYGNSPGLVRVLDSLYVIAKTLDPGTLVLNRSGSNPFNDDYGKFDLIERPIGEYEHRAEFAHDAFEAYLRGDRKGRTVEFPVIAHEYPLVASYPNPELIAKYDTIPYWIDTAMVMATKNGLDSLFPVYVKNTEAIQAKVRKEMLEEARKFPELDGYSMLRFTDCGAYVSGVVDDFADPKNVSAKEFLQTNGETVLLCSWNERVLTNEDTLKLTFHCSHHGGEPLASRGGEWEILLRPNVAEATSDYGGQVWRNGEINGFEVPAVDVKDIANISLLLNDLKQPQTLTIRASVNTGRKKIKNEWTVWVFPKIDTLDAKGTVIWDPNNRLEKLSELLPDAALIDQPEKINVNRSGLILTDSWDEHFYDYLDQGGNIWVLSGKTWPWPEEMGIFGLHITRIDPAFQAPPVFPQLDEPLTNWLTICSNHPKRYGNSGTIVFDHPAIKDFPNNGYCDMQFWPMIYRAKSLRLKDFPGGIQPMIQAIDNFYRGEYKGYVVDMQVGKGRLLISTLNLIQHLDHSASTRYMAKCLFDYMTSADKPVATTISADELRTMIDDYAKEIAADPPRVHSEMGARYKTLWERRLSPGEVIVLYPYEADGISKDKLDIHYEYAQTQWYYKAAPGDELTWTFENDVEADYNLHLNIAGIFPSNKIKIELDGSEAGSSSFAEASVDGLKPECSGDWQTFVETVIPIKHLKQGEHTLKIIIPGSDAEENGVAFLIRDMQLKEKLKK